MSVMALVWWRTAALDPDLHSEIACLAGRQQKGYRDTRQRRTVELGYFVKLALIGLRETMLAVSFNITLVFPINNRKIHLS